MGMKVSINPSWESRTGQKGYKKEVNRKLNLIGLEEHKSSYLCGILNAMTKSVEIRVIYSPLHINNVRHYDWKCIFTCSSSV